MISVIVTVYQQRLSLLPLLYCLRNQECDTPFEVIVCDDGSSQIALDKVMADDTLKCLNLRYIWQWKNGYRAARSKNNGIRCADGDILVFVDGDILVKPDYLQRHLAAHLQCNQLVCNPRRWIVEPSGNRTGKNWRQSEFYRLLRQMTAQRSASLFDDLNKMSHDEDRGAQRAFSRSRAPWMSCIGFSLSIERQECVYFDEQFQGWGPEDREFALRMTFKHGYTVQYRDDIEVYHLNGCSTGREPSSYLPKRHPEIVLFLINMIYFRNLYRNVDLSTLLALMLAYRLDPTNDSWHLRSQCDLYSPEARFQLPKHLDYVENWLLKHDLYPAPPAMTIAT